MPPQRSARSPSPSPYEEGFSFLSLPVEIRLQIYELLMVRDRPIRLFIAGPRPHPRLHVGILGACRLTLREAAPVLYGRNRLDFTELQVGFVMLWLELFGQRNANSIRHVTLCPKNMSRVPWLVYSSDGFPAIQTSLDYLARYCPRLRTIALVRWADRFVHEPEAVILCNHDSTRALLARASVAVISEIYQHDDSSSIPTIVEDLGWAVQNISPDGKTCRLRSRNSLDDSNAWLMQGENTSSQ